MANRKGPTIKIQHKGSNFDAWINGEHLQNVVGYSVTQYSADAQIHIHLDLELPAEDIDFELQT